MMLNLLDLFYPQCLVIFFNKIGKIVQIPINLNDKIKKGQLLVVMEAMKMEHSLRASADGVVKKINFKENDMIQKGKVLVEIEYN
jgi:biotin carboxyl carrier protein